MKSLHLPSYFHGSDRHGSEAQLHKLLHSDRFWAIAGVVVLVLLMALMTYLAIRHGSGNGGMTTYYPYY